MCAVKPLVLTLPRSRKPFVLQTAEEEKKTHSRLRFFGIPTVYQINGFCLINALTRQQELILFARTYDIFI